MLLFYLAYFASLLETSCDNENPRASNRALREKRYAIVCKGDARIYGELVYCCNTRQITAGHYSLFRTSSSRFFHVFCSHFPSPQSLLVSKETI